MEDRDLAIFVWTVVAAVSLVLILKDAILGTQEDEDDRHDF